MPISALRILVDWDGDGDYLDAGEDVTTRARVESLNFERGKDQARVFSPPMAARLGCDLVNVSRDYSPENSGGPLFGLLEPGKSVRVEADVFTAGGTLDAFDFEDGTAFDFEDGTPFDFEEGASSGDIVASFVLWNGILTDVPQRPSPRDKLAAIPGLGRLARLVRKNVSTALYQNITTDEALSMILDELGVPVDMRVLSMGDSVLEWWWRDNADAFASMLELLATEGAGAAIYEDELGRIVFENRLYRSENARSTVSQFTFTDTDHTLEFTYSPDFEDVQNRCVVPIVRRAPGPLQTIWTASERLVMAAGEVRKFVINSTGGDPFIDLSVSNVPRDTVQTLTPSATLTGGAGFKVGFRGIVAAVASAYNATAADIQAKLEGLSSIGADNVLCSGGPINLAPVDCKFIGAFAGQNIEDLIEIIDPNLNPISAPAEIVVVEEVKGGGFFIEKQSLRPTSELTGGGPFQIVLPDTQTTGNVAYNASAAAIQTAIRAKSGWASTNCSFGPINTTPVMVAFTGYAIDLDEMTITGTPLTTSISSATIAVTQAVKGGESDYVVQAGAIAIALDRTSGASATLTITAGGAGATVDPLRASGRPVSIVSREQVENDNDVSASVAKFGVVPSPSLNVLPEISRATALGVANSFCAYYLFPRPTVTLRVCSRLETVLAQQMTRQISDRITIVDAQTGVDADFWIERIRHQFVTQAFLTTDFGCEKAD